MKTAVIDLGSISARMTIWDNDGKIIYQNRIAVRLSENLEPTNRLSPAAMVRAISALSIFSDVIEKENCTHVRAVATEAVRRAQNKNEFIKDVFSQTGIKLEVLSGDDESYFDYLACRDLIGKENALILDMGGGSFELIKLDGGSLSDHISLPYGAVVATDKIGDKYKLLPFFQNLFSTLPLLSCVKAEKIVAMGGSARCLCLYVKGTPSGEIEKDELLTAFDTLLSMDKDGLSKISAFSGRADVVLAGIAPFCALLKLSGAKKIVVTQNGLREGIYKQCLS